MAITEDEIVAALNARLDKNEDTDTISDQIYSTLSDISKFARWPDLHTSVIVNVFNGDTSIAYPANFRILDYITIFDGTDEGKPLDSIQYPEWLRRRESETSASYEEPRRYAKRGKAFYLDPIPDTAKTYSITGVDTGNKTFTIEGSYASRFVAADSIKITGSPGNDGTYTVASSSYSSPSTSIVVSEAVPDATVDGVIDPGYRATIHYWRYHPDQETILYGDQFQEAVYNGVMAKYLEGLSLTQHPKYRDILATYHREIALLLPEADDDVQAINYPPTS